VYIELLLFFIGGWHFLPREYYEKHQLRAEHNIDQEFIFDLALADPEYDTIIYFHGNALHRAAPWRVDLYKVCT
jgi:abhydrolase domain-containing protein 12